MSTINNVDPLAAAAALLKRKEEMEAEIKKLDKQIYQASKATRTPTLKEIRLTEKGQVSFYFNFQKWPVTMGKEAVNLLFSPETVAKVRGEVEPKLLSYAERKEKGLLGNAE
jgi:hypothetical protein